MEKKIKDTSYNTADLDLASFICGLKRLTPEEFAEFSTKTELEGIDHTNPRRAVFKFKGPAEEIAKIYYLVRNELKDQMFNQWPKS